MRLSRTFWQTFKETPADAEIPSHQLMIRAGLIHKSGSGIYNLLPFGLKIAQKIEQIIREEHNRIGCNEVLMTVVTPGELWQKSGRWDAMGGEMLRFKDKADRDLCISPTNEEAVVDIFSKSIKSYKNLPTTLYQINTKFRDEIRPRFGLLRGREFIMKDAYSFHIDKKCLDEVYEDMYQVYSRIVERMNLEFIVVEADAGAMASADQKTHEFQVVADNGEDKIIYSPSYAANLEKATTKRKNLDFQMSGSGVKEVHTPDRATIEEVASFLKLPEHQTLKSLVYYVYEEGKKNPTPVLMLLLGDDQLNELKLKNYFSAEKVVPATDNDLLKLGFVKGFIGPFNLDPSVKVLVDSEINPDAYYIVGAQKEDYHLEGFSCSKELNDHEVVDLRESKEGDLAPNGKDEVTIRRGIEVGHIFQLGDKYTRSMEVSVLDQNGKAAFPLMGCYGIGVTRLMGAAIEQNHDDKGIIWPSSISPFDLHYIFIGKSDETKKVADEIYNELLQAGIDVLFDDRNAGPGFKFKDAELLGVPWQLVLGERDFNKTGELAIVDRRSGDKQMVKRDQFLSKLKELL